MVILFLFGERFGVSFGYVGYLLGYESVGFFTFCCFFLDDCVSIGVDFICEFDLAGFQI